MLCWARGTFAPFVHDILETSLLSGDEEGFRRGRSNVVCTGRWLEIELLSRLRCNFSRD